MQLPIVFDIAVPRAAMDHKKAQTKWNKAKAKQSADAAAGDTSCAKAGQSTLSEAAPVPCITEHDASLALLLGTALKILLG